MKPFNLEAALAGKPVVTRDGQPVPELHLFTASDCDYPVVALIGDTVETFTKKGEFRRLEPGHRFDLFMASEKREGWVNLFRGISTMPCLGNIHPSKLAAEEGARLGCREGYIGAFLLTWEE